MTVEIATPEAVGLLASRLAEYQAAVREHAFVEADYAEEKRNAFMRAQGTSIGQRDREVDLATTDLRMELTKLRAELECARAAWETQLALIRLEG